MLWELMEYQELKDEVDEKNKEFEKKKKESYKVFDEYFKNLEQEDENNNSVEVEYEDGNSILLTQVIRTSITFDEHKLLRKLGKERMKEITKTKIDIIDLEAFVKVMRRFGIGMQHFDDVILVRKEIDHDKINRLEETGKITHKDIEGCYEVKASKPYYQTRKRSTKE